MMHLIRYILFDLMRNRVVMAYAILLFILSIGLFGIQGQSEKALLTLWNIVLLAVPMMSLIFSTIYYYNSGEFIELLLAQPIQRKSILISIWISLTVVLTLAFWLGAGIHALVASWSAKSLWIVIGGSLLTWIFVALAILIAVLTHDKTRGMGIALLTWFYFVILFDSMMLILLFNFSDYPMEKPMVFLSLSNPVDLARILVLMKMDASALMGFSGAVFQEWLGAFKGSMLVVLSMFFWIALPIGMALKIFEEKDF